MQNPATINAEVSGAGTASAGLPGSAQKDEMTREIEVRLRVEDAPVRDGVAAYFEWVERECRKAGIPFSDGEPENGVLYRRDDPEDFGCTIWVYVPNVEVTGLARVFAQGLVD